MEREGERGREREREAKLPHNDDTGTYSMVCDSCDTRHALLSTHSSCA